MTIYLAGCGKIGQRLGQALVADGQSVVGLKRQMTSPGFPVISIDLMDAAAVSELPLDAQIIVFTVTPRSSTDQGYAEVYETILDNVLSYAEKHANPPLLIFVSSTGVYGQQNGEWVDERSETKPQRFSGQWVLAGEEQLRRRLEKTISVRFSGIYGEGRTRLIQQAQSGNALQQDPPIWTNRIHEDDCVGVLSFLIKCYQRGEALEDIYLVSDDTPVSLYDITAHLCQQSGKANPPIKTEHLSENQNKRCDNRKIKALGYVFQYPDYIGGYREILKNYGDVG